MQGNRKKPPRTGRNLGEQGKPRRAEKSLGGQIEASRNRRISENKNKLRGNKRISGNRKKKPRGTGKEASETLSGSDVRDSPGGFGLSRLHLDSESLKISGRRKLELSVNRSISRGTKLYELSFQGQQSPPAPSLMEFCLSTTRLIRFSLHFFILGNYINRQFKQLTSSVKPFQFEIQEQL